MNITDGRKVWIAVFAMSFAFHAALLCLPMYRPSKKPENRQIINIEIKEIPKPIKKDPPKPAPKKVEKPKPVQKPKPAVRKPAKPKPAEIKEPVPKPVESVAEPVPEEMPLPAAGGAEEAGVPEGGDPDGSPSGVEGGTGSGPPDGIVDASSLTVLKKVLPSYPSFSRKRREEGRVTVIVTIEDGAVVAAEVENSSGFSRLDTSALEAVKQWRFDQRPPLRARVPFVFKLTN